MAFFKQQPEWTKTSTHGTRWGWRTALYSVIKGLFGKMTLKLRLTKSSLLENLGESLPGRRKSKCKGTEGLGMLES